MMAAERRMQEKKLSLEEHHRLEKQGYRIICQQSNRVRDTSQSIILRPLSKIL